jgi:hypothetical protein
MTRWDNDECPKSLGTIAIGTTSGPSVNAGTDQSSCSGTQVTLQASGTGGTGNKTYKWTLSNGTVIANTANTTVNPTANTVYTVRVTDQNGCTSTDQTVVTVRSFPTGTLTKSDPLGGQNNGSITINFSDVPNESTIRFSLDGGATYQSAVPDNSGSVTYSNLGIGSYTIFAKWGDSECPAQIGTINLTNIGDPIVIVPNTSVCQGETTSLTATTSQGTAPYTITWSNGLGTGTTKSVTPMTTTTYTITVTDANNRTSTDQATVTVNALPTGTISTNTATCSQNNGSITIAFPDEPTRSNIKFSLNGGNTYQSSVPDNSGSVTYNNLGSGTYSIFARWGDNSCPVSIGTATVGNNTNSIFCNPTLSFEKMAVDTTQAGTSIVYTFRINNGTGLVLNNIAFTDNLTDGVRFIADPSVVGNTGLQVIGTTYWQTSVNLTLNNIPLGVSSFEIGAQIPNNYAGSNPYCNQATLSNLSASNPNLSNTKVSDNPNTSTVGDPTCTYVWRPEICNNGIDDDLDGLDDCDDPDCKNIGNTGNIRKE